MAMELFRELVVDAMSLLRKSCVKANGSGVLGSLRIEGIVATAIICTAA
eukprot:CAMPEP_0117562470 /NCGR_PEP_ID=MMETSP0784-20121206/54973_1 /TAXON_ID=39447 /ORGANISM="" /LENGTH=48 /DNA_ID= /DNA_START= /DNA_END= /DNA_ORIENTATION=